jgi:Domain of unknown function (DUF4191)
MAKAAQPEKVGARERFKQIGMVVRITAKRDRLFVPLALAAVLLPILVALLLILVAGLSWIYLAVAVLLGALFFLILLNTRATKAMMADVKGQPGAAASVVETMRGDWRLTPAVASTTQFDMVHLVVGRPGVILIGEGNPSRVRSLLGPEKRRLAKVIGNVEMRDIVIGDDEGQVPIEKLRTTLMKLPRSITPKEVSALNTRLKALSARPQMPKGAIPKNMRPQMGGNFRAPRGR